MSSDRPLVLLTGATGYVGGRLLKALEQEPVRVRCLARNVEYLRGRIGANTEAVKADVLDRSSLEGAFKGVDAAYYLIHSMGSESDFVEQDRVAAANFGEAALAGGVRRLIYLGGLGWQSGLSSHLESRQEVGRILRESGVATIELRASIIIGSGSLSFEMIRALVDRLPVMITPRWVGVKAQPIAIEDIIDYLIEALTVEWDGSGVFEIGGSGQASYSDMMLEYARQRGLRRWMIPVPVLTPRLSSLWLGLVTPLYARIGRKLIDSLKNETVVRDPLALKVFHVHPRGLKEAIERALLNEDREFSETRWSDALSSSGPSKPWGGVRFGSRIVDSRTIEISQPPEVAFRPITEIGGENGWYFADSLWTVRGWLDLLVGGPGLRRGRRHPRELVPGDALDWWRVEAFEPGKLLRLAAEMKLPGRAWLQFEVQPSGEGSVLRQTAIFDPVGFGGLAYWYALYPVHRWIFAGMLRRVADQASGTR
ncbi:MAG TPA: SDR family oxidoreductase [Bryobacterales bacterium]|nr:SDR family oxidoreductase [Bryobacterales bacterium]